MYTKLFGHHLLEAENGNLEDRHAVAVINGLIQLHPQCHAYNTWAFISLYPCHEYENIVALASLPGQFSLMKH